jgi:predicted nucleotidyltransferase component of viral defense system
MNQKGIAHNDTIKIKFEIDIEPPGGATTELHYRLLPFPYQVRVYDKSSLFAGKLHAIIARGWNNRVKGRDLYDFLFYLASNTPVNLIHLEARLKQTKHLTNTQTLSIEMLKELLHDRFNSIDYQLAKNDVNPFIKNKESLDLWSADFFINITRNIKAS